jgi:hypothetical protein
MAMLNIDPDLLGCSLGSEPVQRFVTDWPQLDELDEEELAKAVQDRRLSLINAEHGLYLFFTDQHSYWERYGAPKVTGDLILCRISALLNFHPQYACYTGAMPWSITAQSNFDEIVAQAGAPAATWPLRDGRPIKARWNAEGYHIDVSGSDSGNSIKLVSLHPKRIAEFSDRLQIPLPKPAQMVQWFGKSVDELAVEAALSPFSLMERGEEIGYYGEADCSAEFGMELYFKPASDFPEEYALSLPAPTLCLSGVRYRADLDFTSNGYQGELPWGLTMDDPPAVVRDKAPGPSVWHQFDVRDGAERWSSERCDTHILYSFLDDHIYRVTLLAKGCYD